MDETTKKIITDRAGSLENQVSLELVTNNTAISDRFITFCDILSGLSPKISIVKKKDSDAKEPCIKIRENLIFKAVPEGKMTEAFLDALTEDEKNISQKVRHLLKDFTLPVTLNLYISEYCPFCPKVFSDISQLSAEKSNIELIVIDAGLFPALADKERIVSAPTLIYDDDFRWTGSVKPEEVAEVIGNTNPENLSASALRTLLETGKASLLAELMINTGTVFPSFYELVTHEKWPVRLGAMVVMEEFLEKAPALSDEILGRLWKNFMTYDDPVKGDIIYMTGETGNDFYIDKISRAMREDYSDELIEAAEEALLNLKES